MCRFRSRLIQFSLYIYSRLNTLTQVSTKDHQWRYSRYRGRIRGVPTGLGQDPTSEPNRRAQWRETV